MFFPNQYTALSTQDALQQQGVASMSIGSSPSGVAPGLFFLQPNQISSNARLLAFAKENDATLNFPQKLMLLLSYVDNERDRGNHISCISWVRDGHAFIIKNRDELVDHLLPLFFREGKFSSFTRKLYRWGFRQICIPKGGNKKDRDLLFGHEHFQRDNKALMSEMRSVTAAGTRRAIVALTTKKKARKSKEKEATCTAKMPLPVSVPSPVPTPPPVETNANQERSSPIHEVKPQDLVQVHLERLLGGNHTAKSLNAQATSNSTQSALDYSSFLKANSRTSPTRDVQQDNLVQTHLQRLLSGSHTAASIDAQTPFQTQPQQQNSSAYDALLKAKTHSLMPAPVQNQFLGLNDTAALQNHVNYLKAMSSMAAAPSPSAMSFDVGARLQALRQQIGSNQQQQQQQQQQRPTAQQPNNFGPASMGLPKNYLDLIQGNSNNNNNGQANNRMGQANNNRAQMPNLILPESNLIMEDGMFLNPQWS